MQSWPETAIRGTCRHAGEPAGHDGGGDKDAQVVANCMSVLQQVLPTPPHASTQASVDHRHGCLPAALVMLKQHVVKMEVKGMMWWCRPERRRASCQRCARDPAAQPHQGAHVPLPPLELDTLSSLVPGVVLVFLT